jgi:hypothetical protein
VKLVELKKMKQKYADFKAKDAERAKMAKIWALALHKAKIIQYRFNTR